MLGIIIETYNLPQGMAKETEEKILPSIIKQTTFRTIKGVAGIIYTDDDQVPVWFKTKDSELIPTVYTAWRAPFILSIVLTHPHVIEVLEGGADLMLPGSVPPFDDRIEKGSIVGIADTKNPYLIKAVGRSNHKLSNFKKTVGTSGVAIDIYHSHGDMLFRLIKKKIKAPEEPDLEIKLKEKETEEEEEEEEVNEPGDKGQKFDKEEKEEKGKEELSQPDNSEKRDVQDKLVEEVTILSIDDVDHFFKRSLFQTLTQQDLQFPLPASIFMNHIIDNLATDIPAVQIKKTSWKKSAKYLKAMEKEGFLKLKGKGDDITVVSSVTKDNNEQLKHFVPYRVKKSKPQNTKSSRDENNSNGLVLEKLYKPTSPIRQIFNDLDMVFAQFYDPAEVKDILNKYIAKHNLVNEKNKKTILLDDVLFNVTPGSEKVIGRDQILSPFLKKFSEFHRITKAGEEERSPPVRGTVPQVQIITETKIGRKVITRTSNFEPFGVEADDFSNELKVKCSGSTTIGQNTQNPKLMEVTVQGPHGKIVIDLLIKKYGLNPNWIKFDDKSKPKKKRS
ncbi:hypothetical protein WICMUC_004017 [Wickerhamomyces mucosus]|uniref:SUI1 domain-containing protein n=1 Tax=Wickerhamomyces mucosus TaxID=1378264 RepID=A0A9P8PJK1_9ASCO|nr:hypothetical protein WICMUC_004017 [Wickerhamomyces mucosus]